MVNERNTPILVSVLPFEFKPDVIVTQNQVHVAIIVPPGEPTDANVDLTPLECTIRFKDFRVKVPMPSGIDLKSPVAKLNNNVLFVDIQRNVQ